MMQENSENWGNEIDWNYIFVGQKGLKNFKQNGTPYPAAMSHSREENTH